MEQKNIELSKERMKKEEMKLEMEKKQVDVERNFFEFSKGKQIELENLNFQLSQKQDSVQRTQVVSESEKREFLIKNKQLIRKLEEANNESNQQKSQLEELKSENQRL